MANMLYNGVELPDINTVWTHELKEQYSCACLADWSYSYGGGIRLILSERPPYWDSSMRVRLNGWFRFYKLTDGVYVFNLENSTNDYAIGKDTDPVFWTSVDIINTTDNTVYLAASDPVDPNAPAEPTFDKTAFLSGLAMGLCGKGDPTKLTGSDVFSKGYKTGAELRAKRVIPESSGANGDGFALYNGVKLPKLPEWDKSIYPHSFISANGDSYTLFVFDGSGASYNSSANEVKVLGTKRIRYRLLSDGTWSGVAQDFSVFRLDQSLYPVIWTNRSIGDYLAASDPIPLDGYTVIEWDGNTEGLVELSNYGFPNMYMISETHIDFSDGDKYICTVWNGSENVVYPDQFELVYQLQSLAGGNYWTLGSGISGSSPFVASADVPSYSLTGTAFMKVGQGLYTTLFAYKAT